MLTEQLQHQIEQEGNERAEGWQDKMKSQIAKAEYELGADKYASLWQAAEAKAERYEKALEEIQAKATFPRTENESGVTIYNILKACNEALTPKTSSYDTE